MNDQRMLHKAVSKDIWILAEQKDGKLHSVSFELLGRGRGLADARKSSLCAVVIGHQISQNDLQELIYHGADIIYLVEDIKLKNFLIEPYANVLRFLVKNYHPEILIAAATTTGRTVMPYVSAQIRTGLTADCTELAIEPQTDLLLQTRPAIGGNIMATIKTPDTFPQMATVRPKSSKVPERKIYREGEIISIQPDQHLLESRVSFMEFLPNETGNVSIEDADIVIAGGAGMKKAEGFDLLERVAGKLGGAVGASRLCVDHGWQPYQRQIGLSGKTINPHLYIACGISGAIQHVAGIQTSELIIAINSDPNAQIFQIADLGIVGDLFEILPALLKKLESKN